ncbi:hypothetical protein [Kitasatospora cineracea]|uniref:LPXTG-motif cell wall-anchored protein n=1 Tax=Kitasatospora cineracea TaxID=88074 RepID=A0A8G1UDP7_9ACTN|nr:hypothetical protein [Kitasatospora cineracea]ROR37976.1 hypothetical protein EDD39_6138 [Kitasatospora cineracea]
MAPTTLLLRAAALAVLPLAAFAAPAHAAPGDNGDVKIHEVGTPTDDQNDQPKVCSFYLDAFNFDTVQQVTWHIDQQPPTGTATNVRTGQITLVTGHGFTPPVLPQLPDGHYELFWNFAGESGAAKHKVFMVDCSGVGSSPSPSPSASPSPVGGGTSPSPGSSPSGPGGPGGPGAGGPGRTPQGGVAAGAGGSSRDWNPAEVTVGAALVAGAGYLVVRRRRRSRR